jgi:GTP-binding protein
MLPVIALVGRPNVGKSTLFNYLTRSRDALVANEPGVTRDRQYGKGSFENHPFIVVDTGGLEDTQNEIFDQISQQTFAALEEADIVFWVTDARAGFTSTDQQIAKKLHRLKKTIYLLVNKSDGLDENMACADFYSAGMPHIFAIAATQGRGLPTLLETIFPPAPAKEIEEEPFPDTEEDAEEENTSPDEEAPFESSIKVAIVGRPNAGKSTLVNRILGEERVVVFDAPGTTRDSIFIPFERRGKKYTLIDTAGVRRRRSINNNPQHTVEKFSVVKTLQAITDAHVVVFVVDAHAELADQDLHLLGYILDAGRSLVIAVNKWDGLEADKKAWIERELDRRLVFVQYARIHFISALHGTGVGNLFTSIDEAYHAATRKLSTSTLTEILERAIDAHQPPAVVGRRIKLRYAHSGGSNPPIIVIHGNQTDSLPTSYQRYLANYFRDTLSLRGTPVRIELRSGDNPYKDKKNVLTARQVKRRKRLMKHVKK